MPFLAERRICAWELVQPERSKNKTPIKKERELKHKKLLTKTTSTTPHSRKQMNKIKGGGKLGVMTTKHHPLRALRRGEERGERDTRHTAQRNTHHLTLKLYADTKKGTPAYTPNAHPRLCLLPINMYLWRPNKARTRDRKKTWCSSRPISHSPRQTLTTIPTAVDWGTGRVTASTW